MGSLILTATTLKDCVPNVERFVVGNQSGGVDHQFIFLDGPDPEVEEFLLAQPHVTLVRAWGEWWGDTRPDGINARQRINANVARAVLAPFAWAGWSFHIDGDEILDLSAANLESSPRATLRVLPHEAVSRMDWSDRSATGLPTTFKRLLEPHELESLVKRGLIDQPDNDYYFHGHTTGKSAMRPRLDLWHSVHDLYAADGELVESDVDVDVRLFHYESWSGQEFVRKWANLVADDRLPGFRDNRRPLAEEMARLLRVTDRESVAEQLQATYREHIEDDVDVLASADLLVQADPVGGHSTPRPIPDADREAFDESMALCRDLPKRACGRPARRDRFWSSYAELAGRASRHLCPLMEQALEPTR